MFGLQMATVYVPFLNPVFHTIPLTLDQLGLCLLLSTIVFVAIEIEKWIRRRLEFPTLIISSFILKNPTPE